jgi:hypothetical protein
MLSAREHAGRTIAPEITPPPAFPMHYSCPSSASQAMITPRQCLAPPEVLGDNGTARPTLRVRLSYRVKLSNHLPLRRTDLAPNVLDEVLYSKALNFSQLGVLQPLLLPLQCFQQFLIRRSMLRTAASRIVNWAPVVCRQRCRPTAERVLSTAYEAVAIQFAHANFGLSTTRPAPPVSLWRNYKSLSTAWRWHS